MDPSIDPPLYLIEPLVPIGNEDLRIRCSRHLIALEGIYFRTLRITAHTPMHIPLSQIPAASQHLNFTVALLHIDTPRT